MKVTICGSMFFAKDFINIKEQLEENGHVCFIPHSSEEYASGILDKNAINDAERIAGNDLIRKHHALISDSDAVLIVNKEKEGIENYVGGGGFLEIGFAHILNKKIFLLNPIPKMPYSDEISATNPIIINGDLSKIN